MVTVSRRKLGWLGVSVVLVLAVGLLAAAVVFALMLLGFRHYTATAYVLFRDRTVELLDLSSAARRDLFQTIKADQLQRMNSRYILRRALERPEVANLSSVRHAREAGDPTTWLSGRFSVTLANNSDLAAVSVRCGDPRGAAVLTNAVVDTYFDEVINCNLPGMENELSRLDRLVEERHKVDVRAVEGKLRQENSSIRNSLVSDPEALRSFDDSLADEARKWVDADVLTARWDSVRNQLKRPPLATVYRRAEVSGPWPF